MWKEIIICIVIILMIFLGNYITQKYTTQSVTNLNGQLNELEEKIQTSENDIIVSQMNELKNNWDERYKNLSFFIEHDELEKVETKLTAINGYIEADNLEEVRSNIQEAEFILKHIEKKYAVIIENIF